MQPLRQCYLFNKVTSLDFLFNSNFGAADRFAGKAADFAGFVGNYAVASSVYGKVTANNRALAGTLSTTDLAHNNLAGHYFLAAKQLNT